MKRNSRFSLALHTLGHMAASPEQLHTSSYIAEHSGTHPVVVRRILGKLRYADLLTSAKGQAGGWQLARSAHDITLADVYIALNEHLIATDSESETTNCSIEQLLQRKITTVMQEAEQSLIQRLDQTSIAELVPSEH